MNEETIGIILAGGIGSRFKGTKPKQYYLLNGKEMISYTIDAFKQAKSVDGFVVVVDEAEFANGHIRDTYGVDVILGGKTRNHSLKNALDYIHEHYPLCKRTVENNAACPMVTPKVIDDIVSKLDEFDYAQCTYKITDALGSYKDRVVNREDYFLIQTPVAYRFPLLYSCFDADNPNGHPAVQLPDSARYYNYFGFKPNVKVTYPEDIELVEVLMKRQADIN